MILALVFNRPAHQFSSPSRPSAPLSGLPGTASTSPAERACADVLMDMAQAITFRLSDLDTEDMRRRCDAHQQFLTRRPDVATFSADWADNNLNDLPG